MHIPAHSKAIVGIMNPGTPDLTSPQSFGFIFHSEELASVWEGMAHLGRWLDELQADRLDFLLPVSTGNYSFRLPSSGKSNISRTPPCLGELWWTDERNWSLGKAIQEKSKHILPSRKALSVVLCSSLNVKMPSGPDKTATAPAC